MSGASDYEILWEQYFNQFRDNELVLIKKAISKIKVDYKENFGDEIDSRLIPLIKLLYNKSSIEYKFQAYWYKVSLFECIEPIWKVSLMKTAYKEIVQASFSDDIMFAIQDLFKGRFKVQPQSQAENYLELIPYTNTSFSLKGLFVLETNPSNQFRILVISTKSENIEHSIKSAMNELQLLAISISQLNVFGNDPVSSIFHIENRQYSPKQIIDISIRSAIESSSNTDRNSSINLNLTPSTENQYPAIQMQNLLDNRTQPNIPNPSLKELITSNSENNSHS